MSRLTLSHLRALEAESNRIMPQVVAEFARARGHNFVRFEATMAADGIYRLLQDEGIVSRFAQSD